MKVAYFSPLNPVRSGISDYSESLLEELSKRAEIDLFVDGYRPESPRIDGRFRVVDCRGRDVVPLLDGYDAVLYQMGGTPSHHGYIYEALLRRPGVVVLHDMMYQGFFHDLYLKEGKTDRYTEELVESYGPEGKELAKRLIAGERVPLETLRKYPMNKRMIDASRGVVVHSRLAADGVRRANASVAMEIISHHEFGWSDFEGTGYRPDEARSAARRELGIPAGRVVFASFGFIVPTKRIEVALRAFTRLRRARPEILYCLVGEPKYPIREYVRFLGIEDAVRITGHVPLEGFRKYLEAADVCINLRYPCQGETSGAMLRMLALGKPSIVTNNGWFAELPDDACAKVDVDDFEEVVLHDFMEALSSDREYAAGMSENSHGYARRECSLSVVAEKYLGFLERCS